MAQIKKSSSKIQEDMMNEESNENFDHTINKKSHTKPKKSTLKDSTSLNLRKSFGSQNNDEMLKDNTIQNAVQQQTQQMLEEDMEGGQQHQKQQQDERIELLDITNNNEKEKQSKIKKQLRTSSLDLARSLSLQQQESMQKITKRLMISKIILNNFKSYAGKQIIGPFHKNMTSIVGPNGSGKSNLIESLLFVFGRSAKQMRLQKLHQLIHNSSYDQLVKKASVEMDSQDYEIIPKSEFIIKRTVHHTSVTKYAINNQESTQAEVIAKLKEKGIDLDNNRFLILQGEVEQISLMKPKGKERDEGDDEVGLLEYLEDIIGSDKYKKEIKEKEKIHETLIGTKREKGELVRIAEKDLEKLQDSKDLAIQYVRKEKELFQIQNLLFQQQRHKANKEFTKNQEEVKIQDQKLKEEKKKQYQKAKENEDLFKKMNEKKKELQRVIDNIENNNQEFQALEKKDIKLKNDLKHLIENEVKSKGEIEQLDKQKQQILNNCQEVKEKLPKAKKDMDELAVQKETEERKYQDMLFQLKQNTEQLQAQKQKIEAKIDPYQKKIDETKQQVQVVKNEINIIMQGAGGYQEEIKNLQQKVIEFEEEINTNLENLSQIDEAMKVMGEEKTIQNQNIQNERRKEEILKQEMSQINSQLAQSKAQNFQNQDSYSTVNELLKAQKNGDLRQIRGRLGDLGGIEQKYDIAISTACPQLNNIVVENIEAAQTCVEYLKYKKLSKCTFIALDKVTQMWQNQMDQYFEAPQGSQRLFDLVKVKDQNLKAVFYSVLRNTLVCDTLDQATAISYSQQRHRVVTVDGNIVESSGAISGGGKPRQGLMSKNVKHEDNANDELIEQLKEQLHRKQTELENVIQNKKNLDLQLQEVMKDEREAKNEKQKLQDMYEFNVNEKKSHLTKIEQMTQILSKKNQNERNKASLEQKLIKLNTEQDNLEEQVGGFKQQLQEVDKKIEECGGEEFKRQKDIYEIIKANYIKLDKEIQKMNKAIQSANNSLEVIEQEKKTQQNKLKKYEEDQAKIKVSIDDNENKCLEIIGAIKANEEKKVILEAEQNADDQAQQQAKKLLDEILRSLEKTKDELDKAKELLKKSEQEYKFASSQIEKNRKDYEGIIKNYDFLDQLDEIAAFDKEKVTAQATGIEVDQQQQGTSQEDPDQANALDNTMANMTMLEIQVNKNDVAAGGSGDNEDFEMIGGNNNKKKIKMGLDRRLFKKFEVGQDLTMDELDELERVSEQLNIKKAFEEDNLKKMQPNINSIIEFKNKYTDFKEKLDVFSKIINEMKLLRSQIDLLRKKRFEEFMSGFNVINCKLKETYQLLTHGGDAELELIDSLDPFSEGVVFSVRPYKKSWKQMQKLSGGEKTLSSLALVFSLHYYKPNPLYFMDEIDAALDFKNVQIVAKFIKERTKNAQFIIISLRNNMFELADRLVGIYKTQDTTKTIAIEPHLFTQFLPAQATKPQQTQQQQQQMQQNEQLQSNKSNHNIKDATPNKVQVDGFIENLKSGKKSPKTYTQQQHLNSSTKKPGQGGEEEDEF